MYPTLEPRQFVISFNWYPYKKLKKGDLIVIEINGRLMIKRGHKYHDRELYVLGDNPSFSEDSRQFGWVSKDKIVGKVIFKYN